MCCSDSESGGGLAADCKCNGVQFEVNDKVCYDGTVRKCVPDEGSEGGKKWEETGDDCGSLPNCSEVT